MVVSIFRSWFGFGSGILRISVFDSDLLSLGSSDPYRNHDFRVIREEGTMIVSFIANSEVGSPTMQMADRVFTELPMSITRLAFVEGTQMLCYERRVSTCLAFDNSRQYA